MNITYRQALPEHRAALESLLKSLSLPVEDLPDDLSGFTLAFEDAMLVGSAGVEPVGQAGLLRSVAVAASHRSLGVAAHVFQSAIENALKKGIHDIWLITNTADQYFKRHGFEYIDRENAPHDIAGTAQFKGLCPSSAVVMRRIL
ncbi:MAG: GNAT family N-acetyltransferase [Saprospiraceae bacterium]|nr:GNAT family N-acetyltransferase [Saprospiraceae bacterium]